MELTRAEKRKRMKKLEDMSINELWELRVKLLRARIRERDFDRNQKLIAMSDQVAGEIERRIHYDTLQRFSIKANGKQVGPRSGHSRTC